VFFRDCDGGWSDDRLLELLDLTAGHGLPIDVAVIPSDLSPALAAALLARAGESPGLIGMHQHGFDHRNRGMEEHPTELHPAMPRAAQRRAIEIGKRRLRGLLGLACDPIFTPAWGRCTRRTGECLVQLGFVAVSADTSAPPLGIPGLIELPTTVKWFDRGPADGSGRLDALGVRLADAFRMPGPVGVMFHHELMDEVHMAAAADLFGLLAAADAARPVRMWPLIEGIRAGGESPGRILLVSHGGVDATGRRQLGGGDVLLNAAGREHSRAVCALLSREAIDAIYTSRVPRAVETILPVALERSLRLIHDDNLREPQDAQVDPDIRGHLLLDDTGPDESLAALHARAVRFLERLSPELADGRTVVVVGNDTINQMLLLVLGAQPQLMDSASVVEVTCAAGSGMPRALSTRPPAGAPIGMEPPTEPRRTVAEGFPERPCPPS
jgi:broad specificity phosphatase PhoE